MPAPAHSLGTPFEVPVMKNDGPFFRPAIVGHETVGKGFARRLYHDYSADALEKMEMILITLSGFAQIEFANTRERLRRGSVLLLSLPSEARIFLKDEGCPWEFFYIFATDRVPAQAFGWLRQNHGNSVHLPVRSSAATGLSRCPGRWPGT